MHCKVNIGSIIVHSIKFGRFAYCLECRIGGSACSNNIVNSSSELLSEFLPDSISSTNSLFDVGVLVGAVLAESSYFGATRNEHSVTRQESFQDLITHLREGRALSKTYLKSFLHVIELNSLILPDLFIQFLIIKEFRL